MEPQTESSFAFLGKIRLGRKFLTMSNTVASALTSCRILTKVFVLILGRGAYLSVAKSLSSLICDIFISTNEAIEFHFQDVVLQIKFFGARSFHQLANLSNNKYFSLR